MNENKTQYSTFYFFSVQYQSMSYGLRVLYDIVAKLNSLGIRAYNVFCAKYDPGYNPNIDNPEIYKKNIIICDNPEEFRIDDNDIAVYLDTVQGNPLNAKRVLRYLLNKPYVLTGTGIEYQNEDYIIAYSYYISKKLPQLFYLIDERNLFSEIREHALRSSDSVAVYLGKTDMSVLRKRTADLKRYVKNYKRINVITRWYPSNRVEALSKIADCSLLISFDPLSNMNYEAILVGVPVLMMDPRNIQGGEFNIDQSCMFAEYNDINEKQKDIDSAFLNYCNYIESFDSRAKEIIDVIVDHFIRYENNEDYRSQRDDFIEMQKENELNDFLNMHKMVYTNIVTPDQIPLDIRQILGIKDASCGFRKEYIKLVLYKIGLFPIAKKIYNNAKRKLFRT